MSGLKFIIEILCFIGAVWLAIVPAMIYAELKRQGEARREEALKIISLLVRIAGSAQDRSADEAASIQAAIDARKTKGGQE